jgi:beta-N-acetylhexosaminidase
MNGRVAFLRSGWIVVLILVFCVVVSAPPVYGESAELPDVGEWSDRELAAQMLFLDARGDQKDRIKTLEKKGVGGIVLFVPVSKKLKGYVKAANKVARNGVPSFIASDEEGGLVQRFRDVIYRLPSAEDMGKKSDKRITSMTKDYGKRLKKFGVNVVLGPVGDLDVKGRYMSGLHRCFGASPGKVRKKAAAWAKGYERAGLITCYKHWPGKGSARDTHKAISKIPSLKKLEKKDMKVFDSAFEDGCVMVMVGHVIVPGLTKKKEPASLSKKAMAYLREKAGPDTIIITDSLSMGAVTGSLKLSEEKAAVKALCAGADMAMATSGGSPDKIIDAVTKAIKKGDLPRARAEESVERILRLKRQGGLLQGVSETGT